jgi:micrococcal nuclease
MIRPEYSYRATVVKVIDADTVDVDVALGFHVRVAIRTRLLGINAPEVATQAGKDARDYLRGVLPPGTAVIVRTYADPKDKYGRWLAELQLGEVLINDQLVDAGHAVPYDG